MTRTTISLPEGLAEALRREARRRGTSASDVAREALADHLHMRDERSRPLPFAAVGRSGKKTTARRMEELIASEWRDDDRDR